MFYQPVRCLPVARFFYKGSHSHPVRRTVLVIESKPKYFRGYELREGSVVRPLKDAPIKTFSRRKIADEKRARNNTARRIKTMTRVGLLDLVKTGA